MLPSYLNSFYLKFIPQFANKICLLKLNYDANYFILSSGDEVEVTCYTFSEHVNSPDGLDVGLATKEFVNWLVKFAKY